LQLHSHGVTVSEEAKQKARVAGLEVDKQKKSESPIALDGRQHLWLTPEQAKMARERKENPQPKATSYLDRIPKEWIKEWKNKEITKEDWCPENIKTHARDPEFRAFITSSHGRFDEILPYKMFWLCIEQAMRWLAEKTYVEDLVGEEQWAFVLEEFRRGRENRLYWAIKYGYIQDDAIVGGFRKYDASTPQALLFWMRMCKFSAELGKSRQAAITSTIMLDAAIVILTTPSYSGVMVTDDVEYTGKKIFKQKLQSSLRKMMQKNTWMKADKWLWSAKSVTAMWGESTSKEDQGVFQAEYTVAASNETQAINGTAVSEIDVDECQNVSTYTDIKLEARPAMLSNINGVIRVTRMIWAYGTGSRKQSGGGAFEMEYKNTLAKWRRGDDTSTMVPLFFDRTCRPGATDESYLEEYAYYMTTEEEGMKGMTKEERMSIFLSAYPNKVEDMFLTSHKHVVPALTITEAWEMIERYCHGKGLPVPGSFKPVYDTMQPMPEGSWYPFFVRDVEWKPEPPDSTTYSCKMFMDRATEPWAHRYYQGTDPCVVGTGSSMFASAILDAAGGWEDVKGTKSFNPTIACILNDSKPAMEEVFNQCALMGMYYKNHQKRACTELVEVNRGGEYMRWKQTPQFNLGESLIYRTMLPPKYQGGGHLYGIDMKNSSANSRKTELFYDIVALVRSWGPRTDDFGRKMLNIWFYEYWTQLYNIEVEEKANQSMQFGTRNKNAYNDDLVYAVQYAHIAYQAANRVPTLIDYQNPEYEIVEEARFNYNTMELQYVKLRKPVVYA